MPACCPKVRPIYIRRSPVLKPGGCVAKLEIMKDASIIPPALWSYEDMREIPTPRTTSH
jgi:hypothetical protein